MTECEGFLGRWSRLKREAAREVPAEPGADLPKVAGEPLVDLEALPPLESLGVASDYTPFLAKGVPEALRCAALRKAWASDPAIADFGGFAEYDWDCNAPGYGALRPTDGIQQLLSRVLRDEPEERPEPVADAERGPEDAVGVPYASYYLTGFLHDRPLARLRLDMQALGLERQPGVAEPEDHIATLCEIMAGLITGEVDAAPGLGEREFFSRHLAPWAQRFFGDVERARAAAFYRPLGTVGRLFMEIEDEAWAMAVPAPGGEVRPGAGREDGSGGYGQ
jgi:Nitrate reductase delta subunit/Protein of unknown function (DUF3306)